MKPIYLDNNATTKPLDAVIERVAEVSRNTFANPGSPHLYGRYARKVLEESRESMASILGASPREIIFTSGGTEASNMAIRGFTQQSSSPKAIAFSEGEHSATLKPCLHLEQQGWKLYRLAIDFSGRLCEEQFDLLSWNDLRLVSILFAHNETGVIQNIKPLTERCLQHNVPLHLDAVQAIGKMPIDFHSLNATSLAISAHKFHGPRGVGALLLRKDVTLSPLMRGGHQEQGYRPGTEPVALIAGMATALEMWNKEQKKRTQQLTALRNQLQTGLEKNCVPAVINGSQEYRLPNTLNIAFPPVSGEALLVALDLEGIACSLGSACASGSAEPSPVLIAMGCSPEIIASSVRFSVSINNTAEEIDIAIEKITKVVHRLQG